METNQTQAEISQLLNELTSKIDITFADFQDRSDLSTLEKAALAYKEAYNHLLTYGAFFSEHDHLGCLEKQLKKAEEQLLQAAKRL